MNNIFSKAYWTKSKNNFKSIKILSTCAVLIALQVAASAFYIPVGDNLRVMWTFAIVAVSSCISGPLVALASGFIADIISFMLFPSGAFFFGYTLSSMLGAFIYALFTYNTKITIIKLALSKLLVNLLVNVLLGSLWSYMMFSKGYIFYATQSLIKNITLLPFEVIFLVIVFKFILPLLHRYKLIESKTLTLY